MKKQDKPKVYLPLKQFKLALVEVAKRSELGHIKYADIDQDYEGFTRTPIEGYQNALVRHLMELGEPGETKLDHLGALAWNALALLEMELRYGTSKVPSINQFTSSDTASV